MNMIGLNGSLYQVPTALGANLIDDLLQPVLNWPNQDMPPLRTKDQMIHAQMHTLSFMLIVTKW